MRPFFLHRRPVVLLEVLIAFALVALCALPLIYPHVFILRSEKKFVATVELDHLVNLLFVDRLQKLYLNEIAWSDIESGKALPVDEAMIAAVKYGSDLPFDGTYQFINKGNKKSPEGDHSAYLFDLVFEFTLKKGVFLDNTSETYAYTYQIAVERKQK